MVSGTLYTYPGSFRANKVLIAASYSGSDVKVDPNFEYGKTNASCEFLKKFPLGKVPAFEDSNGSCLNESNAIVQYVSNEPLLGGSNPIDQALVRQYVEFAENEILPSACTWTFPTLGFRQYNKQDTEKAMNHIKKCLGLLNDLLLTRTFLVGERVTVADITLCCNLVVLYVQVLDPKFREPYGNVNRWFNTCINQPNFKKILGDITLCEKMSTFDNKRYQELHPKEQKGKKSGDKKQATPKKDEKKDEKESKPAEAPPQPKKEKVDLFPDCPVESTSEAFADVKVYYYNTVEDYDKHAAHLFELFKNENLKNFSFWHFEHKYPEENPKKREVATCIEGFINCIEPLRKHVMLNLFYSKHQKDGIDCFKIHGLWFWRGDSFIFDRGLVEKDRTADQFNWRKLNLDTDRAEIEPYLFTDCAGFKNNLVYEDFKCFK